MICLLSRVHFSEKVIPKLYEVKAEVESDLSNAEFVALSTDGRTYRSTESYIAARKSALTKKNFYKTSDHLLQKGEIPERHACESKNII